MGTQPESMEAGQHYRVGLKCPEARTFEVPGTEFTNRTDRTLAEAGGSDHDKSTAVPNLESLAVAVMHFSVDLRISTGAKKGQIHM